MVENTAQSGKLKFSVDTSLLFELGERLVTKPSIALAELVKNAYDADATRVNVIFDKVSELGGMMIIEDNGHGMTFEQIQDYWMRIATRGKRVRPVSSIYCRSLTGAKGIGRLAARRLGTRLTLQSIAERADGDILLKENVTVDFDWGGDFSSGQDLVDVPVSYRRTIVPPDTQTGVTLLIEGVRDAWTKKEVDHFRRDLLSVQSPFPDITDQTKQTRGDNCQPDPGFSFELIIDGSEELKELSGKLGDAFLETAWAKLEGKIDAKGIAHYDINIQQKVKEQDSLIDTTNVYPDLKGVNFRVYYFVYRPDFYVGSSWRTQDASKKGRQEGGVRIYLDGFRVFPYGDPGDDWLRLDEYGAKNINLGTHINPSAVIKELAKPLVRPWLNIPKNNQLFGAVAISQVEHPDIQMNVTRERLIETAAFNNLQQFIQNGVYWATIKYAAFLAEESASQKKEQEKEQAQSKEQTQTALSTIEGVKIVLANQAEIPESRRVALLESLNRASEQIKRAEEERISEISMLRVLASAGTTLLLMNHQLQAFVSAILQI